MSLTHTTCPDVRFFLRLNFTTIVNRPLTKFESDSIIVWSILLTAIIIPNAFLVAVIMCKRSLRTYSSILVGSLCVANVLYCLIYILPVKIIVIGNSIHPFTNIYCQLSNNVIRFAFVCCMNFHICSISLEKFIAISSPFWYNQISVYKSVMFVVILLVCWILPTMVAFLPLIIHWWRVCPYFCILSEMTANRRVGLQVWNIFWAFLMFLLPTSVTIIFYIRIFLVAKDHVSRIRADSQVSSPTNTPSIALKAVKTVAIVVGVYLLLQTPYNVYQLLATIDKELGLRVHRLNVREWLFYLASLNSVASPIIYGFFNKNLRDGVLSFFRRLHGPRTGLSTTIVERF
ncbi:uncharacterized protein TRIADDRAFT_55894 [Trichoplax adhaerens]|uniref:G-protein coupled receptors family 1 profile domain-containing protein n=1 Tax=Trichoplax adhaerens TaxID=10228 RepID=B3RW59_TRIAD|nr:hypothetical protein TRIADDRAFT_55894 [Trichoplax adhaerens]EDV26122.1 hypothetical protein TRIADDRAFT_55894 [Trichoplax adhaerens]|eukprot:XP_002112155.1 hypothetical protein TRIADDRAFT_55894 [Trichoplax adhaerens]